MTQLSGTYFEGIVRLDKSLRTSKPLKVTVVFEEDFEMKNERLSLSDFSFLETQELLKDYKGSFSEEVITERRSAL